MNKLVIQVKCCIQGNRCWPLLCVKVPLHFHLTNRMYSNFSRTVLLHRLGTKIKSNFHTKMVQWHRMTPFTSTTDSSLGFTFLKFYYDQKYWNIANCHVDNRSQVSGISLCSKMVYFSAFFFKGEQTFSRVSNLITTNTFTWITI